jgi:hypothetical protein
MLTQYKNIDEIVSAKKSVSAERIPNDVRKLFDRNLNSLISFNSEILKGDAENKIELHVYSGDSWITGTHQVTVQNKIPTYIDSNTKKTISFNSKPVAINLYDEFANLKLTSGNFRIVVNFFKNLIGNYNRQHLVIDEISPDRTELRLRSIDPNDPEFLQQITNYIQTTNHTRTAGQAKYKTYLLNFSRNQCVLFVNSVVIGDFLYVKLLDPLPTEYDLNFKCWIVEEQKNPYTDRVSISPAVSQPQFKTLSNPNWYANAAYNTSTETGLKNWNDLLGSSIQTSQQIVDAYFSGSLSGISLNIDFTDFNNFIFYSSATDRLENFKYKLQLLEYYNSQSAAISLISGSVATTNAADYNLRKANLISGFDSFEKYLYYESSSRLTTYEIPAENPNVASVTGSYISPVPKTNSSRPYNLYPVTSSQFTSWYNALLSSASYYDTYNINALKNSIPEFIRLDTNNLQLELFVNMLGHHYDILYTYINHMSRIHKREENPKLGMPNELLYSVAKQFGWNLTDGNQHHELWQYVLGTSETGTPLTGSNTVGDPSVPSKDMTGAIWRRIVNNLPLLLKSKGTKRSVQALLSCYGIPQSLITVKEYGGPRIDRAPVYEKLNFDYALDLINNTAGTVTVNYSQSLNSVEVRFKTDSVITNPLLPNTMTLFTIGSNAVTIDYSSGTLGTIQINGTPSADIEMFDGGWLTALLRTDGSDLEVVAKRAKYGKIVAAVSASVTATIPFSGSVVLGGTSAGSSRLQGELQELRFWSSSLQDSAFNNHVKAPAAYDGNVDAYSELVFRLPLTQKINHTATSSLSGVQPVSSSLTASFAGWSTSTPYDSIEETYYYDGISLGAGTYDDNKIRLESNELVGTLDFKTRAERSQYDKAPLDTNRLGVYFSPQTMIDEDIIAQLGFTSLDDYIGDPGETEKRAYPALIQKSQDYWKKYVQRNDINAYIKIFTLFDLSFFRQLDQLLPARTNKTTGILIQPNILERSKDTILPAVTPFNVTYNAIVANTVPTASGNYLNYLGTIDGKILTLTAQDDDQWQGYLTSSAAKKYDGTTYDYEYLYWNGTEYITGSTPYWRQEGVLPVFLDAVTSEFRFTSSSLILTSSGLSYYSTASYYGTSSYATLQYVNSGDLAQVQDYLPVGIDNQRYSGAKMTSADFNINSTQTVDGGPVVEWRTTNGNQLIYQTNGDQGSFVLV